MSCRLISGPRTQEAAPISWSLASDAGVAVATPTPLYSAPSSEPAAAALLRDSERRVTEAYQKGLSEGEAAAAQRMAAQVNARIEQLSRSIEQLAAHRAKIQREAEPELVKLSLAIARRILRRELSVDPDALLGLLKAGLEKLESSDTHRVRAHPEHAPVLVRLLDGAARQVTVVADATLPVGAVVFETSRGSVDAGLETQLREIERGFADVFPK
jgi:flagellar assembly protein FliH